MSPRIQTILCCIAMAPGSDQILMRALQEAHVHGAVVHVLNIIPSFDAAMATPIVSFMGEEKYRNLVKEHKEETTTTIRQEIEELKIRIVKEHLEGVGDRIGDVHVYEGDPELEILHMADTLKADMIVMGTHARKLTPYPFMGSVAKRVLRGIRVPVLIVPPIPGSGG